MHTSRALAKMQQLLFVGVLALVGLLNLPTAKAELTDMTTDFLEGEVQIIDFTYQVTRFRLVLNNAVVVVPNDLHLRLVENPFDLPKTFPILAPMTAVEIVDGEVPSNYIREYTLKHYIVLREKLGKHFAELSSSPALEKTINKENAEYEILEDVANKSKTYGGDQDDQSSEIISKEDAIQMFQMNLEMWNSSVKMAAEVGGLSYRDNDLGINVEVKVEAQREPDTDVYSQITKYTFPVESYMKVLPIFSKSEENPQALTILIVYPLGNPASINCTNENMAEKLKSAVEKEMAPEFSVSTSFKQTNEGCLVTFSIEAQKNLGYMNGKGLGVPTAAIDALRLAAEEGNVKAQYKLGVAYANGHGVNLDYVKSYMWSYLAAANGDENARFQLDALVKIMTASQTEAAKRLAQEWEAKYIVSSKGPISQQSTWPKFGNPQNGEILGIDDIKKWLQFSKDRWEGFLKELPKVSFEGWILELRNREQKFISLLATHLESGMGVMVLPVYICTDNSPDVWFFNSFYNKGSLPGFGTEDLKNKTEQKVQKTIGQGYKISSKFETGKVHDAPGSIKNRAQEREYISIVVERFPRRCE